MDALRIAAAMACLALAVLLGAAFNDAEGAAKLAAGLGFAAAALAGLALLRRT